MRALAPQPPLPLEAAKDYEALVLDWDMQLDPELRVRRNHRFGTDPAQCHDVFWRMGMRDAPVLIFWHGGGWTNGYKEYVSFMAEHVTRLGMVLVAPDYRLAPEHKLEAAYGDALSVVREVARHAADFGGRGDRLLLGGHSAGAHLAALVSLRPKDVEATGVDPAHIRACLAISGIMDLHHPDPAPDSLEARVYSMMLREREQDATLSPINWTAGNAVPMWLSHGEFDTERVMRSNQRMAALLALQPGLSRLDIEPGLDHFATHTSLRNADAPWYARLAGLLPEIAR